MKCGIDIVNAGTLTVLCQIEAIGNHVIDPAVGHTIDDMRAVSEQLDRMRFLIEHAIALRIQHGRAGYWEDYTDGGAA
jgi:hypothetical protein